jgi:soluble lytic murein transglycosylase
LPFNLPLSHLAAGVYLKVCYRGDTEFITRIPLIMFRFGLASATIFTVFLCALLSPPTSADTNALPLIKSLANNRSQSNDAAPVPVDYTKQRALFLKAEYAARLSKSNDYHRLYKKLDGYPLQPYVELAYLKGHTYLRNKAQIRDFLNRYKNTPMEWPLRKKWLRYLAKKDKQQWFIEDYRPTSDSALHCYHLRFQLAAGVNQADIFTQADTLWLSKKSQPKACDPLFKAWEAANQRTDEKVWQRLIMAATKGDHTLIPYLKRISPEKDQYLADLWYKTRRRPQTVSRLKLFPNKDPKEKQILLYGIKRLIWKDTKLALRSWEEMQQQFNFTSQEKAEVTQVFAIRLAKAGDKNAPIWLEKVPADALTSDIVQWRMADSLRRGKWQEALAILQSLPPKMANKEAWTYWLARSLAQTGATQDADKFFKKVAIERHYYGFLAATILGNSPNLAHDPLIFTAGEIENINNKPGAQRALEFRQLERFNQARREWNSLNHPLSSREKLAAAKWANQLGWFSRAIFTLPQVGYWDDVGLRFPLAYKKIVAHHSNRNKLESSFTFAIARRESSFMADAYSSAGALGLMQMMPNTARFIAKKKVNRSKLFSPNTNVRYGTDYLKYLLKKVKGNEVIAAAAYNAGITRVNRWLKVDKPLSADVWIETIPFKETRNYVKSVMAYRQIYSNLLGHSENKFKQLATMQIGL